MSDELRRLRDVVKALVAERRAWVEWRGAMTPDGKRPTKESADAAFPLFVNFGGCRNATDQALACLADVSPELVAGYQPTLRAV